MPVSAYGVICWTPSSQTWSYLITLPQPCLLLAAEHENGTSLKSKDQ
jgi:hypothetical protein